MPAKPTPLDVRIFRRVIQDGACWAWQGARTAAGYGLVGLGARSAGVGYVHRVVYELMVGEIPAGLDLDHLCRVRHSCNPEHLDPVPRKVNAARGIAGPGSTRPWRKEAVA